ncbi:hypothetical protein ILUMI_08681 [Ignelater luminosus]|uniref:Mutator-like transposase domain-containing protein n=1 Tax=Ignelater luminosus TaxID=2038154 RepID=A0A8K0GF74_IGNLU|nr:hypothetical protein ILUMI_08681 [Ignelater luminosus]
MCNEKFNIATTEQIQNKNDDINTAAVEGIMSIGGGFYNLEDFLSTLSILCISEKTYKEKMKEAAKREADYAKEHNMVDKDGIPCITVVADGCWSKLSYKTNYNASFGTASIVGLSERILKLRRAVTNSVNHWNQVGSTTVVEKINLLRKDIDNSFNHVFGEHKSCEEYFCPKQQEKNHIEDIKSCAAFYTKLVITVKSISQHARSLIYNLDSNVVDHFHLIIAKFVGEYRRKLKWTAMQKHKRSCHHNENPDYGVFSQKPDMNEEEYNSRKKKLLDNLLLTEESRAKFENDTILQCGSSLW